MHLPTFIWQPNRLVRGPRFVLDPPIFVPGTPLQTTEPGKAMRVPFENWLPARLFFLHGPFLWKGSRPAPLPRLEAEGEGDREWVPHLGHGVEHPKVQRRAARPGSVLGVKRPRTSFEYGFLLGETCAAAGSLAPRRRTCRG